MSQSVSLTTLRRTGSQKTKVFSKSLKKLIDIGGNEDLHEKIIQREERSLKRLAEKSTKKNNKKLIEDLYAQKASLNEHNMNYEKQRDQNSNRLPKITKDAQDKIQARNKKNQMILANTKPIIEQNSIEKQVDRLLGEMVGRQEAKLQSTGIRNKRRYQNYRIDDEDAYAKMIMRSQSSPLNSNSTMNLREINLSKRRDNLSKDLSTASHLENAITKSLKKSVLQQKNLRNRSGEKLEPSFQYIRSQSSKNIQSLKSQIKNNEQEIFQKQKDQTVKTTKYMKKLSKLKTEAADFLTEDVQNSEKNKMFEYIDINTALRQYRKKMKMSVNINYQKADNPYKDQ